MRWMRDIDYDDEAATPYWLHQRLHLNLLKKIKVYILKSHPQFHGTAEWGMPMNSFQFMNVESLLENAT